MLSHGAIEYRGGWSRKLYQEHEDKLLSALAVGSYQACGDPMWARHYSPMTPWFLRKNEVMVAVCTRDTAQR